MTGDNNGVTDVFVRDRLTGTTERISRRSNGSESACASKSPSMTPDGRFVVFASCGDLVAPASGAREEVYRYERSSGLLELVSINGQGGRANDASGSPDISADGDTVAFHSMATDLVAGISSGSQHIYARHMAAAHTVLVSRTAAGLPGNRYSAWPQISADGRSIVFVSEASDLVADDTNDTVDVFVVDLASFSTQRINRNLVGSSSNAPAEAFGISGDGSRIVFQSTATDLATGITTPGFERSYLHDRASGSTRVVGPRNDLRRRGETPAISSDGRRVAFIGVAPGLVTPQDTGRRQRVYLYDIGEDSYRALTYFNQSGEIQPATQQPRFSADGESIGFVSSRTDLADDGNGAMRDVFLVHRYGDTILRDGFEP